MRVHICYTIEVDDRYRRALNQRYGKSGLADRRELKQHFEQHGGTLDDDLESDLQDAEAIGSPK